MDYELVKVYSLRGKVSNEIWNYLCEKWWTGRQDFLVWFADIDLKSPLSVWLLEHGARENEKIILDLR